MLTTVSILPTIATGVITVITAIAVTRVTIAITVTIAIIATAVTQATQAIVVTIATIAIAVTQAMVTTITITTTTTISTTSIISTTTTMLLGNILGLVPCMIGTTELILIAALVLLLFGGKKLPELMRGLGQGIRSFKQGMNEPSNESKQVIDNEVKLPEESTEEK